MAQRTVIELIDDMDGSDADQAFRFSFQGAEYEIDLSNKNAERFVKVLDEYTEHARRAPKTPGGRERRASQARNGKVRKWAAGQGLKVSDRGRIPRDVVARYEAAH